MTSNNSGVSGDGAILGTITLGANSAFISNQRLMLGNGTTKSLTIAAGSTGSLTVGGDSGANASFIGYNGTGTLTINGGTVNFNNSTVGTGNGWLNVGSASDIANGTIVVDGGNMNVGTYLKLGGFYSTANSSSATSSLSISNGKVTVGGGDNATSNGGTSDTASTKTGISTLTLGAGGVLNVKQIQTGKYGTDTINFNGGTLQSGAASTTFLAATTPLTVNVNSGGATIDTQSERRSPTRDRYSVAGSEENFRLRTH